MDKKTRNRLETLGVDLRTPVKNPLPITQLDLRKAAALDALRRKAACNRKFPGMWDLEAERQMYEAALGPLED